MIDPVSPIDRHAPRREAETIRRKEEQRKVEADKERAAALRRGEETAFRERILEAERIRIRNQQDRMADEARRRAMDATTREEARRIAAQQEEKFIQERITRQRLEKTRLSEERLAQERLQEQILKDEAIRLEASNMGTAARSLPEVEEPLEELAVAGEEIEERNKAAAPLENEAIRRYQEAAVTEESADTDELPEPPEHKIDLLA